MKSITDLLDEIETRANAATPAPWYIEANGTGPNATREVRFDHDPYATEEGISDCSVQICNLHGFVESDSEFIAHARSDIPKLIAAIKESVNIIIILLTDKWAFNQELKYQDATIGSVLTNSLERIRKLLEEK